MVAGEHNIPSSELISSTGSKCANDHCSRQALKKYVRANNNLTISSETQFDSLFNKALKSGVEKEDFMQPKGTISIYTRSIHTDPSLTCFTAGPSGPVKLAKKEAKPAGEKKLTGAAATSKVGLYLSHTLHC